MRFPIIPESLLGLMLFLVLLSASTIRGQTSSLSGRVIEQRTLRPLAGAHVWIIAVDNNAERVAVSADTAGYFHLPGLKYREYVVNVSYLGYASVARRVTIDRLFVDAGTISLSDSVFEFNEKLVESRLIGTEEKGDTTEYNADAFATEPDANAEELIAKLPGVAVDEDGDVKAQGEDVQQVLVDGQPFFGSDPTVAIRNLPSDAIAKIQVYDKLSDQAQLTGYDDGHSVKVLNIITRPERRRGVFGKSYAGYGSEERYNISSAMNYFDGSKRVSLIGLTNNISQQNFSQQDLLGVLGENNRTGRSSGGLFGPAGKNGSRAAGGPISFGGSTNNFLVGQMQGLTSAHSFGFNQSDSLWSGFSVNTSYFFNLTDNSDPTTDDRRYGFLPDSVLLYHQTEDTHLKNYNHRIVGRYDYTPDSSDEILFTPRFYIQNNHTTNSLIGSGTIIEGAPYAYVKSRHSTETDGISFRGNLVYRRKFSSEGRTLSVDLGSTVGTRTSIRRLFSGISYPPLSLGRPDSLDHESQLAYHGFGVSANFIYTEPFGDKNLLQLSYEPSRTHGSSDDEAYDYDQLTGAYTVYNPRFSNIHETNYTTHRAGMGWRYRNENINSSIAVSYQIANLRSDQSFPRVTNIDKQFNNVLPSVLILGNLPGQQAFRIQYRAYTIAPTIGQLEDLVNKRNLMHVTAGNPDLSQSLTQAFSARLTLSDLPSGRTLFLHFFYDRTTDYIGESSYITTHDTVIRRGIHLSKGAEFTSPVNLDHSWEVHSSAAFGFPVDFIKSNMTLDGALTRVSMPAIIKTIQNRSVVTTWSPGISLRCAVSRIFDIVVGYTANFNRERNDVFQNLDDIFFSQKSAVRLHWMFLGGCVIRTDLNELYSGGATDSLNRNAVIWNMSVGHKLFSGNHGEITFGIHNIFDERTSVTHVGGDSYREDHQAAVIDRYALLTFSYSVR
jgi:hypothetical protein